MFRILHSTEFLHIKQSFCVSIEAKVYLITSTSLWLMLLKIRQQFTYNIRYDTRDGIFTCALQLTKGQLNLSHTVLKVHVV